MSNIYSKPRKHLRSEKKEKEKERKKKEITNISCVNECRWSCISVTCRDYHYISYDVSHRGLNQWNFISMHIEYLESM